MRYESTKTSCGNVGVSYENQAEADAQAAKMDAANCTNCNYCTVCANCNYCTVCANCANCTLVPSAAMGALQEQLAASQAREQQLREAFEVVNALSAQCGERLMKAHSILKGGWLGCLDDALVDADGISFQANKALTLPKDITAISAIVAKAGEVMRGRVGTYLLIESAYCTAHDVSNLPGVTLEDLK